MVRTTSLILIFALLILNALLLHKLTMFMSDHIVFDMDKVRAHYESNLKHVYLRGCYAGTEYPRENDHDDDFTNNSSFWCLEKRKIEVDDRMYNFLSRLGRKEPWENKCN